MSFGAKGGVYVLRGIRYWEWGSDFSTLLGGGEDPKSFGACEITKGFYSRCFIMMATPPFDFSLAVFGSTQDCLGRNDSAESLLKY